MSEHELLIRIERVCEMVGLSLSTIKRLEAVGDFPKGIRVGGCRLWDKEAITKWARLTTSSKSSPKPQSRKPLSAESGL